MQFTIKETITPNERKFTYAHSDLFTAAGFIGRLRADFGRNGDEFWHTWEDYDTGRKSDEFKKEFDCLINALRFNRRYCGMLENRKAMTKFCRSSTGAAFQGNYTTEYAFRIDTLSYTYMLRLNPTKDDYNVYCFCYDRSMFDKLMGKLAEQHSEGGAGNE